jgi:hypothetical protein
MCHGFGRRQYETSVAMTRHERVAPVICAPQPPPSRNDAVARFLECEHVVRMVERGR